MGAYLSHPKTDKASTDEFNDLLAVGASSMQGWRNSQEDAHNAILNFDTNTSFFAVYDGHGGAEVAQYCADKLPEFLKKLDTYKKGELEKALKDAFLGFDKTLLDAPVVAILKILAGEHNFVDEDGEKYDDDDEEDLAELHEESHLPLNEVLEKYKGLPQTHDLAKLKAEDGENSKPQSPFLRGRRAAAVAAEAANKAVMDPTAKPDGSSTSAAAAAAFAENDGPGPSASKIGKLEQEDDSTVSSSSSSSGGKSTNSLSTTSDGVEPDASKAGTNGSDVDTKPKSPKNVTDQNGSVTSTESKPSADIKKDGATGASDATVSGSADDKAKQNGSVASSSSASIKPANLADISSTSKEPVKAGKKVIGNQEDDSTDDDADYDENSIIEAHDAIFADDSSDDGCLEDADDDDEDDDDDDDEKDDDDDDDEDLSDDEEADEDQLANDHFCANMIEEPGKDSGCTAVVSLLHGRDLYVANAGDSRCVISRNGKAIEMSLDHKPEDEEESTRIIKAGGRVTLDGRVNGGLNLSRALGDHAYKMNLELPAEAQMISALPDVRKLIITPEDEFMVLACDGIWNYMSSDEVVEFVRCRLRDEKKKLSQICEELFENCLAPNTMGDGTGCDNMTAVIVQFKEKLQELPASINPTETEDAVSAAREEKELSASVAVEHGGVKRSASPDTAADAADCNEKTNQSKRMKTEDDVFEAVDSKSQNKTDIVSSTPFVAEPKECDSINSNSGNETAVVSSS